MIRSPHLLKQGSDQNNSSPIKEEVKDETSKHPILGETTSITTNVTGLVFVMNKNITTLIQD